MPHDDGTLFNWIVGSVGVVAASLAAAVGTLWRNIETSRKQLFEVLQNQIGVLQKSVNECEEDRERLHTKLLDQQTQITNLDKRFVSLENRTKE